MLFINFSTALYFQCKIFLSYLGLQCTFLESPGSRECFYVFGFLWPRQFLPQTWLKHAVRPRQTLWVSSFERVRKVQKTDIESSVICPQLKRRTGQKQKGRDNSFTIILQLAIINPISLSYFVFLQNKLSALIPLCSTPQPNNISMLALIHELWLCTMQLFLEQPHGTIGEITTYN